MRTILGLFGKSPFVPLRTHREIVRSCVEKMHQLFSMLEEGKMEEIEAAAAEISKLEHRADLTKNDIRNHLPKTLFLPIDRTNFLEILAIQDSIADQAEDIAILLTLKPLPVLEGFKEEFSLFLEKNIEAFEKAMLVMHELHELLESSFGGVEAEKVRAMVEEVAFKEHEADLLQRKLLKKLYQSDANMPYTTFFLWQKVLSAIAAISNLSEKLANRIRMTLDLK